jgi:hypothetical protein
MRDEPESGSADEPARRAGWPTYRSRFGPVPCADHGLHRAAPECCLRSASVSSRDKQPDRTGRYRADAVRPHRPAAKAQPAPVVASRLEPRPDAPLPEVLKPANAHFRHWPASRFPAERGDGFPAVVHRRAGEPAPGSVGAVRQSSGLAQGVRQQVNGPGAKRPVPKRQEARSQALEPPLQREPALPAFPPCLPVRKP